MNYNSLFLVAGVIGRDIFTRPGAPTYGGLSHSLKGIETNGFRHRVQRQILCLPHHAENFNLKDVIFRAQKLFFPL